MHSMYKPGPKTLVKCPGGGSFPLLVLQIIFKLLRIMAQQAVAHLELALFLGHRFPHLPLDVARLVQPVLERLPQLLPIQKLITQEAQQPAVLLPTQGVQRLGRELLCNKPTAIGSCA